MNLVHQVEDWGNRHHPKILDILRVALGIFLFLKGTAFLENMSNLEYTINSKGLFSISSGLLLVIVYFVVIAHMVGGALITLGIYTRFWSFLQIPIVFGAIFFVDIFKSPLNTELLYAIIAMVLLLVFMVIGSGRFSLDHYFSNNELE